MRLQETPTIERIYRELRILTALRLRAAACADFEWAVALEARRRARRDELSRACGAVAPGLGADARSAA